MKAKFDPDLPQNEGDMSGARLPEYVKQSPWYFKAEGLDHLRTPAFAKKEVFSAKDDFIISKKNEERTFKYKPGCCKNCGSPDHTEFDCLERAKKNNAVAKGYGVGFSHEKKKKLDGFEAKRDNFSGFSSGQWFIESTGKFLNQETQMHRNKAENDDMSMDIKPEYGNSGFHDRYEIADHIRVIDLPKEKLMAEQVESGNFAQSELLDKARNDASSVMIWEKNNEGRSLIKEKQEQTIIELQHSREFTERKLLKNKLERIVDSNEEIIPKCSKYPEDVFINGHTSVWGSYYDDGKWGYACCKQTIKHSLCNNVGGK